MEKRDEDRRNRNIKERLRQIGRGKVDLKVEKIELDQKLFFGTLDDISHCRLKYKL